MGVLARFAKQARRRHTRNAASFWIAKLDPHLCAHRYGVPEPYEKLKAFTRGVAVTQASMQARLYPLA